MAEISNEIWQNSRPVRTTRIFRLAGVPTYERQEPIGVPVEIRTATLNEAALLVAKESDDLVDQAAPRLKNIIAILEAWADDAETASVAWNGASSAQRSAIMTQTRMVFCV